MKAVFEERKFNEESKKYCKDEMNTFQYVPFLQTLFKWLKIIVKALVF